MSLRGLDTAARKPAELTKEALRIGFVNRSIHHVLLGRTGRLVGGAELQQQILAQALSRVGWQIAFITEQSEASPKQRVASRQTMWSTLDYRRGNRYTNKLLYLPLSLWRSLRRIEAEIIYHRNPDYLSGIIALFCRLSGKRFVLAAASHWNFDRGREQNLTNFLDRISARWAIRRADRIIVQNRAQQTLLKHNYRRSGVLFYNRYPSRKMVTGGKYLLWVARLETYKQPQLLLQLAHNLPEFEITMVGGRGANPGLHELIKDEAAGIPNLRYLGHRPLEAVEALFDRAALLIHTSPPGIEGFPNTFLQAWSRGIPVLSCAELDGLIEGENLGRVADTAIRLRDAARSMIRRKGDRLQSVIDPSHIRRFFETHFSSTTAGEDFAKVLFD